MTPSGAVAARCTEIKHPGLLVQKSQQLSLSSASECQVLAISERKDFEEVHAGIKVLPKTHAWPVEPAYIIAIASIL